MDRTDMEIKPFANVPALGETTPVEKVKKQKVRYEGLEFDRFVATYYVNKIQSCKSRGIKFELSLTQVKNMLRAKKCPILGIELTHTGAGHPHNAQRDSDVTIDRLNSDGHYVAGNVIAMSKKANTAKSGFESVLGGKAVEAIHTFSKLFTMKGI